MDVPHPNSEANSLSVNERMALLDAILAAVIHVKNTGKGQRIGPNSAAQVGHACEPCANITTSMKCGNR